MVVKSNLIVPSVFHIPYQFAGINGGINDTWHGFKDPEGFNV